MESSRPLGSSNVTNAPGLRSGGTMSAGDRTDQDALPRAAQFATTHWSVVLAAGHSSVPGAHEALETLCRTYWYPLYVYVRGQGQSSHDAQDLTQEFFAS